MEPPNDLVFDSLTTRMGRLHVAVSQSGLVSIGLGGSLRRFLDLVKRPGQLTPRRDRGAVRPYARQLREYLAGHRRRFTLPIDWRRMSPFQRRVLKATSRISYGQTKTYGEIADQAGHPGAARAVGQAMGSNPVPLVIPCHRVLGAGGSLGGYSAPGGVDLKRRLLQLEGAVFPAAREPFHRNPPATKRASLGSHSA
ncbi:MAG: methylated-DNA--[protein]-cysteine S-methyltransferase [Anaerolineales bacterium]|jgi:methylated-DNA-[protein]-cysteine S-methyltransferase